VDKAANLERALLEAYASPDPWLLEVKMDRGVEKLY
jgi:hypothetical protein